MYENRFSHSTGTSPDQKSNYCFKRRGRVLSQSHWRAEPSSSGETCKPKKFHSWSIRIPLFFISITTYGLINTLWLLVAFGPAYLFPDLCVVIVKPFDLSNWKQGQLNHLGLRSDYRSLSKIKSKLPEKVYKEASQELQQLKILDFESSTQSRFFFTSSRREEAAGGNLRDN